MTGMDKAKKKVKLMSAQEALARDSKISGAGVAYRATSPVAKNPFPVRRLSDGTLKVEAQDVLSTNPHLNTKADRWVANLSAAGERGRIKSKNYSGDWMV